MSDKPLKTVLSVLKDVRASMQDAANTRAVQELDEAIALLQEYIEDGDRSPEMRQTLLRVFGKVFDNLPGIIALLRLLSG